MGTLDYVGGHLRAANFPATRACISGGSMCHGGGSHGCLGVGSRGSMCHGGGSRGCLGGVTIGFAVLDGGGGGGNGCQISECGFGGGGGLATASGVFDRGDTDLGLNHFALRGTTTPRGLGCAGVWLGLNHFALRGTTTPRIMLEGVGGGRRLMHDRAYPSLRPRTCLRTDHN